MYTGKIPPYGHALHSLQKQGLKPSNDVYIFAGLRAWTKAENFSQRYPERVLCMPPWRDPGEYHWPVKQCAILIIDTLSCDTEYIDLIAVNAFREGATAIRAISQNFLLTIYDKEMS